MRKALLIGAVLSGAATSAACAQSLGHAPDDDISLWRVGIALLLCLALAVAGAFLLRARMGYGPLISFLPKGARRLKLIETLRLGRVATLSIVECDGKELLLVNSDEHAELIAHLPLGSARRDAVP